MTARTTPRLEIEIIIRDREAGIARGVAIGGPEIEGLVTNGRVDQSALSEKLTRAVPHLAVAFEAAARGGRA